VCELQFSKRLTDNKSLVVKYFYNNCVKFIIQHNILQKEYNYNIDMSIQTVRFYVYKISNTIIYAKVGISFGYELQSVECL